MYVQFHPVCRSYHAGHQAHSIQAKKAVQQQEAIDVVLTFGRGGVVRMHTPAETIVRWNHDVDSIRRAWDKHGTAMWTPEWYALGLPGVVGITFSLAQLDERVPCRN